MNPARRNQVLMVFGGFMLLFYAVPGSVQSQPLITKEKIQEIMDAMDSAIDGKKADGVVQFMSPDISIDVVLKKTDGNQRIQMGREAYRQHLSEAFRSIDDYVFSRSTLKIEIGPDGKSATAVTRLVEKITIGERTIRAVTREVSVFKVIRNDILITSIESVSSVEEDGDPNFTRRVGRYGSSFYETFSPEGRMVSEQFSVH